MKIIKNKKVWSFVGGVVASSLVPAVLKSKPAHNVAVSAVVKSMEVKEDTQNRVVSVKEDAQDIYEEAKSRRK